MNWTTLLFSFEGRVGRGAYWGLVAASLLLCGVFAATGLVSVMNAADSGAAPGGGASAIALLLALAMLWPSLAIQAKRWHDVDRSAWWILINLVPVIGGFIALAFNGFVAGSPATNRFGPVPGTAVNAGLARARA